MSSAACCFHLHIVCSHRMKHTTHTNTFITLSNLYKRLDEQVKPTESVNKIQKEREKTKQQTKIIFYICDTKYKYINGRIV